MDVIDRKFQRVAAKHDCAYNPTQIVLLLPVYTHKKNTHKSRIHSRDVGRKQHSVELPVGLNLVRIDTISSGRPG